MAKKYNVELEVLSSLNPVPGTVVKEVTKDMEGMLIKGVAKDTDVAVITILNVPDEPGTSFKIFGLLAQKNHTEDGLARALPQPGVHALVPALAGNPLKAVRVVLAVVEGGLGGIQAAQLGKIFLEA